MRLKPFILAISLLALITGITSCVTGPKPMTNLASRLAMMPSQASGLKAAVSIRWNDHQVPFIEAENDDDLAFALGLVHAHLRRTQLELLRLIVYGRLSEVAGPPATDIDHALRTLDLPRAAPAIEASLPVDTKRWLERFAEGLNAYIAQAEQRPPEAGLLALNDQPFTLRDIIAMGRIPGVDVNWFNYFALLPQRTDANWDQLWARARQAGSMAPASFSSDGQLAILVDMLASLGRSGSNSMAVAADRSTTGASLIASDPHLGLVMPNIWLMVGVKSPTTHVVGLQFPGAPIFGLGRNPHLAWGGTNMRAASSDLVDMTGFEDRITERQVSIKRRLWFDVNRTVRETPDGPIISDIPLLKAKDGPPIALRWMGHRASDEFTAFLKAMRARNAVEFRAAFETFSVSGQNMLFATTGGEIGQVLATTVPVRPADAGAQFAVSPDDESRQWREFVTAAQLPWAYNPPEGYVASANNKPTNSPFPITGFEGNADRIIRLHNLLGGNGSISPSDLMAMQRDTVSPQAQGLAQALADQVRPVDGEMADRLAAWDGDYSIESETALLFEFLLTAIHGGLYGNDAPPQTSQWIYLNSFFLRDLAAIDQAQRMALLTEATAQARKQQQKYGRWGDIHKLRAGHVLANIPLIGGRYVLEDFAMGGSRETVMKTAHGLIRGPHRATYGSQARHVSDLGDMDANYFLIFGGNDGWWRSTNFADQLPLWRAGGYIRMPLSPAGLASDFPHITRVTP